MRGAGLVDVLGHGRGADEAHGRDVGMGQDGVHCVLAAVDDVDHALGHARLQHQLGDRQRAGRVLLRGLEDEAVAAGDGERSHPERDHGREVEGRDAGADAQGEADGEEVDAAADLVAEIALHQLRQAAGELDHLEPAGDRALRILDRLAVLVGDEASQAVDVMVEQLLEAEHHPHAAEQGRGGPVRESGLGRLHRAVDVGSVGEGHPPGLLARGGIVDRAGLAALAGHVPAADEMADLLHRTPLPEHRRSWR